MRATTVGGEGRLETVAAILRASPGATDGPDVRLRLARASASVIWQPVVDKIRTHLGMQAPVPRRADVRG